MGSMFDMNCLIRGGSRILQGRVSNPSERGTKGAETETQKASRGEWDIPLPSRLGVWGSVGSSPSGAFQL